MKIEICRDSTIPELATLFVGMESFTSGMRLPAMTKCFLIWLTEFSPPVQA